MWEVEGDPARVVFSLGRRVVAQFPPVRPVACAQTRVWVVQRWEEGGRWDCRLLSLKAGSTSGIWAATAAFHVV